MNTRQISFVVNGMYCATCASKLQSALTHVDGVIAATVNYATQRASIIYNADRANGHDVLNAVRAQEFDVRLVGAVLYVPDLMYASSRQTLERALLQTDGIVRACADLSSGRIDLLAFSEYENQSHPGLVLKHLGLEPGQESRPRTVDFYMRSLAAAMIALILMLMTVSHLGGLTVPVEFVSPLTSFLLSGIGLGLIGYPFLRRAMIAWMQGKWDPGVLVALSAILAFLLGSVLAMSTTVRETVLNGVALASFAFSSLLIAAWFLLRASRLFFH